jgi:HEAT repeat protein
LSHAKPKTSAEDVTLELTPEQAAAARAASAWVQQLARTLKTCRLYDRNNPTVVRFREDLAAALSRMLEEHGAVTLSFTPDDVLCHGVSLYPARSRDDNLALPFYRDGVRTLTFMPGVEPREMESLLDLVLQVTAHTATEDDLVTQLWDAGLNHIDMTYVATEGDVEGEGSAEEAGAEEAVVAPWPKAEAGFSALPVGASAPAGETLPEDGEQEDRSDDRLTGVVPGQLEAVFGELDARAAEDIQRFQRDYESDYALPVVRSSLDLMADCLEVGARPTDRDEYVQFLPRVLREAVGLGLWSDAREALRLLRRCESPHWSLEAFLEELCRPTSLTARSAVALLDTQDQHGIEEFLAFARDLGPPAVEWLMRVLAESQQQRARRPLARALAELCRGQPERLAPWLADEHWYVVRNVVHILGWIGGPNIVGLLRTASAHPEHRVRREVVAALAQAGPEAARPLLLQMMQGAETRIFCAILHQLSSGRDPELARTLLGQLLDPHFDERPVEEQRAIYSALAAVGDDDIVPALDEDLNKGGWLPKGLDARRHALARCLARIGTAAAKQALDRGLRSRNAAVRRACEAALGGASPA